MGAGSSSLSPPKTITNDELKEKSEVLTIVNNVVHLKETQLIPDNVNNDNLLISTYKELIKEEYYNKEVLNAQ